MSRVLSPASALAALCSLALALIPASVSQGAQVSGPARILASVSTTRPVVALTFDDGPSPFTPAVLSVLQQFRAHATFFVVGSQVARYPQYARAERAAGDEIGNHTYNHANLQVLADAGIAAQLSAAQSAVRAAAGVTPVWLRPPYGAVDLRVAAVAATFGLQTILWSVDPRDWSLPGTAAIVFRVLSAVHPGSVVIMHDGGGDRSETVAALSAILANLSSRGFQFLTLSQLFAAGGPCDLPGSLYRFASRGVRPRTTHAIFQQWENLYCSGTDLGPATGQERRGRNGLVKQDFAETGHRLVWNPHVGTVRETDVWSWAINAFDHAGILPAWHTTLTSAWFTDYFQGRDWGPALSPPYVAAWGRWQRFRYADEVQRGREVTWEPLVQPRQTRRPPHASSPSRRRRISSGIGSV